MVENHSPSPADSEHQEVENMEATIVVTSGLSVNHKETLLAIRSQ